MLDGIAGPGVQRAMEIVATLGRIYGAPDLVPVTHVQIAGVSYKNLGDAGVQFLNEWADQGATVRVPTTLNPAGMELDRWQEMGIQPSFAEPQLSAIDAFVKMGVTPTMSCTPYLFPGYVPRRGDHLAWAESSAVVFANSILGARSNREGGPSALAAAIVGRTPRYGYHLDDERRADVVVEVRCPVRDIADFGALSYVVGKQVGNACLWFADLAQWLPPLPEDITQGGAAGDRLKTLGAGLAAYGAVALFHVAGYTPEAVDFGETLVKPGARRVVVDSLDPGLPGHGRRPRPAPDRPGDRRLPARQPERDRADRRHAAGTAPFDTALGHHRPYHARSRTRGRLGTGYRSRRRPGRRRYVRCRGAHALDRHHHHGHQRRQDGLLRAGAQQGQDALWQPGAMRRRGDYGAVE